MTNPTHTQQEIDRRIQIIRDSGSRKEAAVRIGIHPNVLRQFILHYLPTHKWPRTIAIQTNRARAASDAEFGW